MGVDANSKGHKYNWWDLIAQIIGILGFLIAVAAFVLNYQASKVTDEIKATRLLDEAFDYISGTGGEPLVGATFARIGIKRDRNNLELANRKIDEALVLDPKNAKAISMKGTYFYYMGKLDESIAAYQNAIEIDSQSQSAYINLGLALYKNGDKSGAQKAFEKALGLGPYDVIVMNNLGIVHHSQHRYDDAIKLYRDAIAIDPDLVELYINLGIALKWKGEIEEAVEVYQKAIQRNPNDGLAYYCLGDALASLDRSKESEDAKTKAKKLGWTGEECGYR